jgi:hypothetical protein
MLYLALIVLYMRSFDHYGDRLWVGLISVSTLNGVRSADATRDELRKISHLYGEPVRIGKLGRLAQNPGTAKRFRSTRTMHDIFRMLSGRT